MKKLSKVLMVILVSLLTAIFILFRLNNEEEKLWPNSFVINELYSFAYISSIELRDGASGEYLTIIERDQIDKLMELIKYVKMVKDFQQEDRVGWQYSIRCYLTDNKTEWFELIIGPSTLADNFRSDYDVNKSPYYKVTNADELLKELGMLFNEN